MQSLTKLTRSTATLSLSLSLSLSPSLPLGNAFKALSGKAVGSFFTGIQNPVAGLMVGILATVLLQSSSTTTSIVVSMVGADIVTVQTAIPMIMGANIGTSVTNTIVSHGHVTDKEEFQRAVSLRRKKVAASP